VTIDQRLSNALADRYRIEREIGAGGMATVYLAEDLKHHRKVAIKVLRPELTAVVGADRFVREIETTAALQHPHILGLIDSGEANDTAYYVMPFVEGESLRDRITREKQLPLEDALRIAREIADALSYAHNKGVIHRDIKPENILLTSGHAVVADFGIARAISAAGGERLTETGLAVGTPAYMSPEQAAGDRDLDGRSDLYALACVLYEMLAGEPPFRGPTVEAVVRQHLTVEPRSVTQLRPAVPAEVAEALSRALAKTPADRFNPVGQFSEALGRGTPTPRDVVARVVAPAPRSRAPAIAAVAILALGAIGLWYWRHRGLPPLEVQRRTQVTIDPGIEIDPALSPDGKFVAYSGPKGAIMVRQVGGGVPIAVVRDGSGTGRWPAWTPDGQRLVYISPRGFEIVPALGGSSRLVRPAGGLPRGVAVSPDGKAFVFASHDSVFVQPLEREEPRLVTIGWEVHSLAWSRDGRWIAFVSGNTQYIKTSDLGNFAPSSIWVAPAAGGPPVRVTDQVFLNVSPAWAPDGSLLYISTRDGGRDAYQQHLTKSGTPDGSPTRLTTGLEAFEISMSSDGSRLAYSEFTETSNVWSIAIPAKGAVSVSQAVPVTIGNQTIENFGISHDAQWIAFSSNRNGTTQIYRMRIGEAGAEPQQLTSDSSASYWADWSPDDKEISSHRFFGERRQVFVMAADGSSQIQVTAGTDDERSADWSPDGEHLIMIANWGTHPALHIAARGPDGKWSKPHPFTIVIGSDTIGTQIGAWSPDGKYIACGCGPGGLVVAPVNGGSARRLVSPFPTNGWAFPQWSADGKIIYHVSEDSTGRATDVIAVPVSGAAPYVVVRFDDPTRPWHRFGFRVRGNRIYFNLGDLQSDIWVADVGRK
jgi:Tol biopolymer transport system component/predicted RNase H-related nuclease YkuK (DUF458 family)